jgi:uncharacterized MnhB-related membrane protein
MWHILIAVGIFVCALEAIRVQRLLVSALWLAGCSALVALMMYLLGAPQIAVIELSVGAGLVTVLFVFAINIAGEENLPIATLIPRPLAWTMVALAIFAVAWLAVPAFGTANLGSQSTNMAASLWSDRSLDVLLQTVLIFSGVLGVLGLLSEDKSKTHQERH